MGSRLGYPRPEPRMNNHWTYVLAAYGIAAAILAGYWWRVERRIRTLRDPRPEHPA
jgi:cytochrome oxidase assembly protein ShyY1